MANINEPTTAVKAVNHACAANLIDDTRFQSIQRICDEYRSSDDIMKQICIFCYGYFCGKSDERKQRKQKEARRNR